MVGVWVLNRVEGVFSWIFENVNVVILSVISGLRGFDFFFMR